MEQKQSMTCREAGRRGGLVTATTHGSQFYQAIGHKGGCANAAKYGPEHFRAIGRKGGERVRAMISAAKQLELPL